MPGGGQVTFAFTVLNNGPYPAANVTVASQLPQGVTFNSVVNAGGGACTGTTGDATFSCAFDTIAAENSKTVSISLTATGAPYEVIVVPYTVASVTPESYPADNSSTGQFFIARPPLPTPTPTSDAAVELAYFSGPADGNANDLYRRSADGAGLSNLTNDAGRYVDFFWSPDGTKIAFVIRVNGKEEIFTVNADGSAAPINRSNNAADDGSPIWSADGAQFAFVSNRDGNKEIYVMNAGGSAQTRLTNNPAEDTAPVWEPPLNMPTGTNVSVVKNGITLTFANVTTAGTMTVTFRARNVDGNVEVAKTVTVKLDKTVPGATTSTVNSTPNSSGYYNGLNGTYTIRYYGTDAAGNNETTKTVTFTIPPQAITPTLASVRRNSNGTYTATFGYTNANPVTFNITIGASNNFSPGSQSRGQTTAFASGTVANAFTVTWDGSSLTWNVKGPDGQTRRVTARKP